MFNAYVVQRAHSKSNKTGKFRVIRYSDYLQWVDDGANPQVIIPATEEYGTYPAAYQACSRLNDLLRKERN